MPPHQTLPRRAVAWLARVWVQSLQGLAGHWHPEPIAVPVRARRLHRYGLERD